MRLPGSVPNRTVLAVIQASGLSETGTCSKYTINLSKCQGDIYGELVELKSHSRFQKLLDLVIEQSQKREKAGKPENEKAKERKSGKARKRESEMEHTGEARVRSHAPRLRRVSPAHLPKKPSEASPIKNLAIIYSAKHQAHFSPAFKKESPARIEAILTTLRAAGILNRQNCTLYEAKSATIEQLETVHDTKYIEFIKKTSKKGSTTLPRSTYINSGSFKAALFAAGGALMAGFHSPEYDAVFVLTRPAGHHATRDMYGGYCLFNNSAIVAKKLAATGKVMILNWDVHASNGTKRIFYTEKNVLTISIHQNPVSFFPNEGFVEEIGSGEGKGYSINIPMPIGSSDENYLNIFDKVVCPIYEQYKPEYIIIECGFDAHHQDPLGNQRLTASGYYELGQRLLRLQNKRLIFTLEGGYNPNTIGMLTQVLLYSLLGMPNPKPQDQPNRPLGRTDKLSYDLVKHLKSDKASRQTEANPLSACDSTRYDVVKELRHHLKDYWNL